MQKFGIKDYLIIVGISAMIIIYLIQIKQKYLNSKIGHLFFISTQLKLNIGDLR